jgi:hypothetical protein
MVHNCGIVAFRTNNLAGGRFMPIPWGLVLKSVPWSEVIRKAPKVVDGALKLWNTVAKKPSKPEGAAANEQPAASPELQAIAALEARAVALEVAVSDLQGQMLESSALIKTLSEQNAQLIGHIETNRLRILWLSGAMAVFAIVSLLGLILAVSRHGG